MKVVNITIDGGLIQNVELPEGVRVEVRDYDTEGGIEEGEIETDENGDDYYPTVYEGTSPAKASVWFDWGDGSPQQFQFDTEKEMDAFIQGVSAAASGFGMDDYRQYDTAAEAFDGGWVPQLGDSP
jgi:hypothetical protein